VMTELRSTSETSGKFYQIARRNIPEGKEVPQHTHRGAGGERMYSSYSFTASALDGGEWSAPRPGRALSPGKGHPVPIGQEAGWAPEPVWTTFQKSYHNIT
jgi:hypothetical protein